MFSCMKKSTKVFNSSYLFACRSLVVSHFKIHLDIKKTISRFQGTINVYHRGSRNSARIIRVVYESSGKQIDMFNMVAIMIQFIVQ